MTLNQLFTNIANAIRAKKGTSGSIIAEDFPDEIAGITTGNLTDEEYEEANDDLDDILEGTTPTTIYPPDWSEIGYEDTPQSIIDGFDYAQEIQENWDSSITNLSERFKNDRNLIFMPLIDTSQVTNMSYMFQGCTRLTNVPLLNLENTTTITAMFTECINLEEIPNFNTRNVTHMGTMCTRMYKFKKSTNIKYKFNKYD